MKIHPLSCSKEYKTRKCMPFPLPETKHKHEDRTQMIDYIPSYNFHICWTTGNHHCIPLPTVVNSGKYGQQKCDLDQWWHGSNTHLVEDTSQLTCNGNVSSGKEASTDLTYGRKTTTWS